MLNFALMKIRLGSASCLVHWGEILKRPMKQVQGMVQDEGRRNFKCSILEIL